MATVAPFARKRQGNRSANAAAAPVTSTTLPRKPIEED
jgi:hypothetical protein